MRALARPRCGEAVSGDGEDVALATGGEGISNCGEHTGREGKWVGVRGRDRRDLMRRFEGGTTGSTTLTPVVVGRAQSADGGDDA